MQLNDLTLEVRDRTLKRVGQVTPAYMDLTARTRWCGVGEWKVTLPGDHPMVPELAKPGSGILLLGPDGTDVNTILSGPTRNPLKIRNAQNPDGTHTFSGVTDEILLQGASAFPDPTIADPQLSSKSRTNDVRTDTTEALLRQYVAYNVANGAATPPVVSWAPAGRLRGFRNKVTLRGTNQDRGAVQKKSPRFQNLLELLQEIVAYEPALGFRMVQIDGFINFEILDSRDRTKFVRFDVENGTITSEETQSSGPSVTDAIVLGQGEGKDRQIVRRQTAASIAAETEWGIPFELIIDQRDTDDPVELQQSGDEKLLEGMGGTAVKMIPADDTTMQVGKDWRAGDSVTTVVDGIETVARVTEVAYMANKTGVRAGAALGDVSGFSQANTQAAAVKSLDSRMSHLERNGGLLPARLGPYLYGNSPSSNADDLIESGNYWIGSGGTNTPDSSLNWEIRVTSAMLSSGVPSVYQEAWRFLDTYGSDRYSRVRTAGVWSAWKVLGLRTRSFSPVSGVSTLVTGNGTVGGTYSVNDGLLAGYIGMTLGSTSAITGDIQFELPMPYSGSTREAGVGRITDASTGANYNGAVLVNSSRLYLRPFGMTQAASGDGFLREYSASATRPITWETGDSFALSFVYPIL